MPGLGKIAAFRLEARDMEIIGQGIIIIALIVCRYLIDRQPGIDQAAAAFAALDHVEPAVREVQPVGRPVDEPMVLRGFRLGARRAMMLKHHKRRATTPGAAGASPAYRNRGDTPRVPPGAAA